MPMKLALDGAIYSEQTYGGVTRVFNEILPRLCALDNSIRVTIWTRGTLRQQLPAHHNIQQRMLPVFRGPLWENYLISHFLPHIEQRVFDSAIGQGQNEIWHFTYTYLGMPRRWKGPKILMLYDLLFETFPKQYQKYCDRFMKLREPSIRAADRIVCISESTKRDLLKFYDIDPKKVAVVPLASSEVYQENQESTENSYSVPTNKPFLLYVGGRYWHKNFEHLLRTYACWPGRANVDLVVAGKPFIPREEALIHELGIEKNIYSTGRVNDHHLAALYRKAIAHLQTARHEGFGITLLEAMACGCPVIATRIDSTVEVAGDIPIYFEPGDKESLLAALDTATSDIRNTERTRNGIKHAKTYSWDATAEGMLNIYRTLLTN